MATQKITIAENYANVKAFLEENNAPKALVEFIVDRAEKSVRKSGSSSHKVSEEQIALRNAIVEVLTKSGKPMAISEMMKADERLATLSTSKISGNITPMLVNGKNPNPDGILMRVQDKKTAKFTLA